MNIPFLLKHNFLYNLVGVKGPVLHVDDPSLLILQKNSQNLKIDTFLEAQNYKVWLAGIALTKAQLYYLTALYRPHM